MILNKKIELSTVNELAVFLKKKPSSIYADLSRRPSSLPPVFRAPGSSKLLFVNIHQWAEDLMLKQGIAIPSSTPPIPTPIKKRGRPPLSKSASLGV